MVSLDSPMKINVILQVLHTMLNLEIKLTIFPPNKLTQFLPILMVKKKKEKE